MSNADVLDTRFRSALRRMVEARGHEYFRTGDNSVIAKLGIDATVPFAEQARFARYAFAPTSAGPQDFSRDAAQIAALIDL